MQEEDLIIGENTYVSMDEFNTFMNDFNHSEAINGPVTEYTIYGEPTDNDTSPVNPLCLVLATDILDEEYFQGEITDSTTPQKLSWPRKGLTDKEGRAIDENTIPRQIKEATILLAHFLAMNNIWDVRTYRMIFKATYEGQKNTQYSFKDTDYGPLPQMIRRKIAPYIKFRLIGSVQMK